MESPAYFLCDAHLGIEPPGCVPDREAKLVRQLESWVGKASHVVIVGDLFEFWYEYRYYVASGHMELYRVLGELVRSGTQVHLLRGNHDFAYGEFFPKQLGIQVHNELVLDIQGKRVYFRHGDGVPKSDRGYRILRRILDFPLNRWLFRKIHPDIGMGIARFVGRNSRKYGECHPVKLEEYLAWANRALKAKNCDICVHGHHHIGGVWNVENGVVASPGEWIKNPAVLRMENGGIELLNI